MNQNKFRVFNFIVFWLSVVAYVALIGIGIAAESHYLYVPVMAMQLASVMLGVATYSAAIYFLGVGNSE